MGKRVGNTVKIQPIIFAWLLPYVAIGLGVGMQIERIWGYMDLEDGKTKQMLNDYIVILGIILAVTLIISVFWWWMAITSNSLKRSFEEKTVLWGMAVLAVLSVVTIWLQEVVDKGIIDDIGELYKLRYGYCFVPGLGFNLFAFPPKTVKSVMFIGGRGQAGRLIVACVMAVILIGILVWG